MDYFPGGSYGKESACNAGDLGIIPGLGRSPATYSIFLSGEFHGQRSLVGYSPWGHRVRSDWVTNTFTLMVYLENVNHSHQKQWSLRSCLSDGSFMNRVSVHIQGTVYKEEFDLGQGPEMHEVPSSRWLSRGWAWRLFITFQWLVWGWQGSEGKDASLWDHQTVRTGTF